MTDMPVVVQHAPEFDERDAADLSHRLFGVEGTATRLPSERDANFLISTADAWQFVLKIANATEAHEILDFQHKAIEHLRAHSTHLALPRILPSVNGPQIVRVDGRAGESHFVRLFSYVRGAVLAEVNPHSDSLLGSLGGRLAEMDRAFEGFVHPSMDRPFPWDLARAGWVRGEIHLVADPEKRAAVERCLDRFEAAVAPRLPVLRTQVIHNDWNDHNVLVSLPTTGDREVIGALDFGDMVRSCLIGDLAVAAAYAMLGKPDPIAAAASIVRGYHRTLPLAEAEISVLHDLICVRLCLSIAMAARQGSAAPDNAYLQISQQAVWPLLGQLMATPPQWSHYVFRQACGLTPCAQTSTIVSWLERERHTFARVVDQDLRREPLAVLDLSVGSPAIRDVADVVDVGRFTRFVTSQIERAGASVGIGRYEEARLTYTSDVFARRGNDGPEHRTVHIGVDVFVQAGTAVYAPLDGVIHSFRNNAGPLDYGPTIILEHRLGGRPGDLPPFYTLYGHLSPQSLESLEAGTSVSRCERIGTIGETADNGGWPPHLHFQIVTDLLEHQGDFPGVAPPSQLAVWTSLSPDPNLILGIPRSDVRAPVYLQDDLLARRRARLGRNLSLSYRRPLTIVRGDRQYLFDADGRRFLDAVNNVPHVGHCHPLVVQAVSDQAAVLNTNTRYLHDALITYAERLCALLPEPLRVCYIVCSGSEANELAIRMARAHTRHTDFIVVDGAYHGNTSSLIDISPYKFDGPGGSGCPLHVHKVRMPDVYRGPFRRNVADAGSRYASEVAAAARGAREAGRAIAAFICESLLSCGGQIVLPDGYLAGAYQAVRKAGGVCIADEVQVGFGRVGTAMWGFETQGVVPDIVTMGKPIGNGFPLAAVVTTPEIAASFDNGMEYFNTFGGNPVACAAGLAVLDVMRDERLQEHALAVGRYLSRGLEGLVARFPLVGDVRGLGLFLGIELVCDRDTLEPAAEQAAYVINRLRDRGTLVSTDGPLHNVIKIKPPLPFNSENADQLVEALATVLEEDPARP
jgi:4-aminobutyrate aminotransferase-like enzyme/Ser/Thr protein kinase RdoA (MazF antagonist)